MPYSLRCRQVVQLDSRAKDLAILFRKMDVLTYLSTSNCLKTAKLTNKLQKPLYLANLIPKYYI